MKKNIGRLPLLALTMSVLMSGFLFFGSSHAEELNPAPESPVTETQELGAPPEEIEAPIPDETPEAEESATVESSGTPEEEAVLSEEPGEEPEITPEEPAGETEELESEIPEEDNSEIPSEEPELLPVASSVIASEWTIIDGTKFTTSLPVVLGKVYSAPTNSLVTVTFTRLPENPGNLTIEEITISEELAKSIGSASTVLYDITSDMENGTFEYTLTLPAPAEVDKASVTAAESVEEAGTAETVAEEIVAENSVFTLEGLDHFTVFIIVDDGDKGYDDDFAFLPDWSSHESGYGSPADHRWVTPDKIGATATWSPTKNISGTGVNNRYAILLSWVTWSDHATNAKYYSDTLLGLTEIKNFPIVEINQKLLADGSSSANGTWSGWYAVPGIFKVQKNDSVKLTVWPNTNGNLSADAVAFVDLTESAFINTPKTVEAYDASQLVAEFKAPNMASAGQFTVNGETVAATSTEAEPETDFITFKLNKALPVGTYSVTGQYKLGINTDADWYDVNGEGSVTAEDTTGPGAPAIVKPAAEQYFSSQPIRNEWTAVTDPSGIKEYRVEYAYDDDHSFADAPYRTTTGTWRNHVPAVSEQGGVKFRVQALDNAGNYGAWSELVHYYYDATKPEIEILSPATDGAFQINPVSVRATDNMRLSQVVANIYGATGLIKSCSQNVGSLDTVEYTLNCDIGSLSDGNYYVEANARDMADTISSTLQRNFIIDRTAPTVIITAPTGDLYNTDVEVRGTVQDANPHHYWVQVIRDGKVIESSTVNSGNITDKLLYTAKDEGNYTITLAARDAVGGTKDSGNRSANVVKSFTIDKTAPAVPTLVAPLNNSFVNGASITNSWSASSSDVSHYVYNSYHNEAATNLRWEDIINAPATSKTATGVSEAVFWWRVKAVDKAGNESSWSELWKVTVDNTAPIITLVDNAEIYVNLGEGWVDPGATVMDAIEGDITPNLSVSGTVDTDTIGEYVLSYDASDSAGNAALTVTRVVRVIAPGSNNMFTLSNYGSGPSEGQGSGEGTGEGNQGGEVAGAETFRFTKDLWFRMKDGDVVELQKRLAGEGLLETDEFTDFFGTLTLKAVKAYQEKYGIPVTGYVGPMTRAELNGEEVAGAEIDKKSIQEQINNLMMKLAELLALFKKN